MKFLETKCLQAANLHKVLSRLGYYLNYVNINSGQPVHDSYTTGLAKGRASLAEISALSQAMYTSLNALQPQQISLFALSFTAAVKHCFNAP